MQAAEEAADAEVRHHDIASSSHVDSTRSGNCQAVYGHSHMREVDAVVNTQGRELKDWPQFPWHEVQPRAIVAMWSWLRELTTAYVR